ncbi:MULTISPECIES: SIMPL domain-containing protein [unclassified Colwellia]|uniref:SIMPL domain-containing protein n=1 Tax=unclassified Colwellia TaxID=196834 RepID=UPI0015F400B3|nr:MULTISPECIES: SIMPL domain-containing protein [unclassified Colwellia]MBA6252148.1 SIMPL domain-containing protein [Colwellia sp. MB3u-55]MBA6399694.1 SIMPL domain-containing protein [Colwellia sp. BRX10-4]
MKLTVIIFIFIFSGFNNASTMPDFPFVTVTDKSVIKVEPDITTLEFYVVTFNKQATLAKSLLNKTSNDVVIILKSNGILETEIKSFEINKQAMSIMV